MSAQSAVQHLAASAGAGLSSLLLRELPDRSLAGMERVSALAIALALALPVLVAITYRYVKLREAAGAGRVTPAKAVQQGLRP
jgi:uncharacterized membrane protein YhfC